MTDHFDSETLYVDDGPEGIEDQLGAMAIPSIETERLILRPFTEDDLPVIDAIFSNPATAAHIGGVQTTDRSWRSLAAMIGHWHLRGFGFWAVQRMDSGETIGWCGNWFPHGWPEPEIGYSLLASQHGQGFATEAATAALVYAYEILGWETAISLIARENVASQKVAWRLGAVREGEHMLFGDTPADIWRHLPPEKLQEHLDGE